MKTLENIVKKTLGVYKNNRLVNINANVFAAAAPSILAASGVSGLLEHNGYSPETIATVAAITDWAVYIPVHVGLHYKANRGQFIDEDGNFQRKSFWKDVGHVYATQIPSIALFYPIAGPLHYGIMKLTNIGGALANQLSYWGTMIVTRAIHTGIGLKTGLFDKPKNKKK
jgi:hypothetical protein